MNRSDFFRRKLPVFFFLLLLVQPCLDVLSFWLEALALPNTLTLALRFAMLLLVSILGFCLAQKKRPYYILALVLALHALGHSLAAWQAGYDDPLGDWANLLRIYQLPLFTLCFSTFLQQNADCYPAARWGMMGVLILILAVNLLSTLTGTDPCTYPDKHLGVAGWFYFSNAQSGILSMVVPVALAAFLQRRQAKPLAAAIAVALSLGVLYLFATRLSYLALAATGLGLTIAFLVSDRSRKSTIALLLAGTCLFLALLPVSPMYRNQQAVARNAQRKQAQIDSLIALDERKALDNHLQGQALRLARLERAYHAYLGGLVDRFGLEAVAERYQYSESAAQVADVRLKRLNFCHLLMEESPPLARWFGLELADLNENGYNYDVENDFHGAYYLCGFTGLALLLSFLAYYILRIFWALCRNFRRMFTLETIPWGIALCTCLTHLYATAGILRRPNASFYLSLTLACIGYLVKTQSERNEL